MTVLILITFIAIFNGFNCQVYYQPVQILIPTINGTYLATNQSVYNDTKAPAYRPPAPSGYYPNTNGNTNINNNTYSYNNGSQDGHLFVGVIQAFDRLLFNQEFYKPSRWWTYREKILEYPKDLPAGYSRHETISAIRIYNKFVDGHGAKADLEGGGLGRQYVKIRLHSTFGKGFRYVVQLYGR